MEPRCSRSSENGAREHLSSAMTLVRSSSAAPWDTRPPLRVHGGLPTASAHTRPFTQGRPAAWLFRSLCGGGNSTWSLFRRPGTRIDFQAKADERPLGDWAVHQGESSLLVIIPKRQSLSLRGPVFRSVERADRPASGALGCGVGRACGEQALQPGTPRCRQR